MENNHIDINKSKVLNAMKFAIPKPVTEYLCLDFKVQHLISTILNKLKGEGGSPCIAGGFVRDEAMGKRNPKDIDIFMPFGSSSQAVHYTMLELGAVYLKEYRGYAESSEQSNFDKEVDLVQKYELSCFSIDIIYLNPQVILGLRTAKGLDSLLVTPKTLDLELQEQGIPFWQVVCEHFDYPCNMQAIYLDDKGKLMHVEHPDAWNPVQEMHKELPQSRVSYLQDKLPMYYFKTEMEAVCLEEQKAQLREALGLVGQEGS